MSYSNLTVRRTILLIVAPLRSLVFFKSRRGMVVFVASLVMVFSTVIILLELTPSSYLVKTTFVGNLETQNLSLRINEKSARISGISGNRITLSDMAVGLLSENTDLTQITKENKSNNKFFSSLSDATYLELDDFIIPAEQAVEVISSGQGNFMSIQVVEDPSGVPSEATVIWNGPIAGTSGPHTDKLGSESWSAQAPLIEIEGSKIDGLIQNPVDVKGLATDRLRSYGSNTISTSSLISGEIQFYLRFPFGSYPTEVIDVRIGEFIRFADLNGQLTNLTLSDNGVRFTVVGEATSIKVGFLDNLRNIHPSILDGLRSVQSLVVIISSIFALLLAIVSAVSLRQQEADRAPSYPKYNRHFGRNRNERWNRHRSKFRKN